MMTDAPNFRLRQARINAGYDTATDAARAFSWNPSTYMGHENGDRPISKKAAQKYSSAFKIDALSLLYDRIPKSQNAAAASLDRERLTHMVGWLLHWRGMPLEEADNLAKAVIEYACKPLGPNERLDKDEARSEARVLMRLFSSPERRSP